MTTDTDYISQLRNLIETKQCIAPGGARIGYRTESVLPRTFELKFSDADLEGYCSFTVSLRNIGHHQTIKVLAHTYDGTKIDTLVLKDQCIPDAVDAICNMAVGLYENTLHTRKLTNKFREDAISGFNKLGYATQCNSRYMIGLSSKKKSILITITASGTFSAELKYIHSHGKNGDRKIFRTGAKITETSGECLVATFAAL